MQTLHWFSLRKNFLVVIALCMGVLLLFVWSVAGNNPNAARDRVVDRNIEMSLQRVATFAALYFDNNGSYGPVTQNCHEANTIFTEGKAAAELTSIEQLTNANAVCLNGVDKYALAMQLRSRDGYYCVDSTGFKGDIGKPITQPSCTK